MGRMGRKRFLVIEVKKEVKNFLASVPGGHYIIVTYWDLTTRL